jgi:DNA repair photolyase
MIVRDVDVLAEASRRADVSVTFSVPTVDDDVWRTTEPGTAPPRQRLRALKTLVESGIRASVGMAPLLPGLSDHPSSIERVVVAARDAGACGIWANLLYLRPGTREHFLACLERDWPELLPDYRRLYARGAYLPRSEAHPAKEEVRRLAKEHGVKDRRPLRLRPPARPEQLTLLADPSA